MIMCKLSSTLSGILGNFLKKSERNKEGSSGKLTFFNALDSEGGPRR